MPNQAFAHRMRTHFYPQQWLLCHMGLYYRPGIYKPQNRNAKTENFGFIQNFRFETETFGLFQPKIIFGLKITETFGFKTEIFNETENVKTENFG
jgi:hypothetical protein